MITQLHFLNFCFSLISVVIQHIKNIFRSLKFQTFFFPYSWQLSMRIMWNIILWKKKYFENWRVSRVVFMRPSRWRKSKTWRSPSSPKIHQKYIYTWNCSYRTPTERWQKTSDFSKGKKIPMYLGGAKEKRKSETKE